MIREDFPMTNATVTVTTLFTLVFATSVVTYLSPRRERSSRGSSRYSCTRGCSKRSDEPGARPPSEIFAEMHRVGLEELSQVKWAILEADGKVALAPARPADRQLKPRDEAAICRRRRALQRP